MIYVGLRIHITMTSSLTYVLPTHLYMCSLRGFKLEELELTILILNAIFMDPKSNSLYTYIMQQRGAIKLLQNEICQSMRITKCIQTVYQFTPLCS